MTPEERAKEIERLRAAGKKGSQSLKKRLGPKAYREHLSAIGSRGGKKKWQTL